MTYFYTWLFDLHNCTGSQAIKGAHLEIIQPHRRPEHVLHANLHQVYGVSQNTSNTASHFPERQTRHYPAGGLRTANLFAWESESTSRI